MYEQPHFDVDAGSRVVKLRFRMQNGSREGCSVGYQIFDPETSTFILEGEWKPLNASDVVLDVALPPERGRYHVYVSPIEQDSGWFYQRGRPFILIDAFVEGGRAVVSEVGITTLRAMRLRNLAGAFRKVFSLPFTSTWNNRGLIRSMVRRDIMARYKGSFGDVLWTVINPLLLMSTYFFVFGIVLQSRFGPDQSRTGFALYFLAGMLPWLGFSEAVGRSPHVMLEHRNFIKKLVFPVEILPVTQVISGLVTQAFATGVFLIGLFLIRGYIPFSVVWLPVLLIPQLLFTLGTAWFLAALGVFVRDLTQMIGFILTLWFFLTPICYPEASLPPESVAILSKNPIYVLVRGYRAIFLENHAPAFHSMWKLWLVCAAVFLIGHAWFYKLRKSFADVI
jgi:lipopolysaccharide transport system permease protein